MHILALIFIATLPSLSFCVCTTDDDCSATLHCKVSTGQCFTCVTNLHCPTFGAARCNTGLPLPVCGPCNSDSDCTHISGKPACSIGFCYKCTSNSHCTDTSASKCNSVLHTCNSCSGSGDCSHFTLEKICSGGTCVECLGNGDCTTPGKNVCSSGTCVECITNGDCTTPGKNMCSGGTCVQCLGSGDCTSPGVNICSSGTCVQCLSNTQCTNTAASRCDSSLYSCGQCAGSGDCAQFSFEKTCSSGTCVECIDNTQCTNTAEAKCDTAFNTCSVCLDSNDCSHFTLEKICSSGTCLECIANANCTAPGVNVCSSGKCVECIANPDCTNPTAGKCYTSMNTCGICSASTDCSHFALEKICYGGSCVQCLANTDCTNPAAPKCDSVMHTCGVCIDSNDCTQFALEKTCSSGTCVECTSSSPCQSGYYCDANNQCKVIIVLSPVSTYITPSSTGSLYSFLIDFPEMLVINTNVTAATRIDLIGIDPILYTYQLEQQSSTQYLLIIKPPKSLPATTVLLTFTTNNPAILPQIWTAVTVIQEMTPEQKEISETAEDVSKGVIIGMAAMSASMILFAGHTTALFNLADSLQSFYYLNYINVKYPANFKVYLNAFNVGGLNFIPNPIWSIWSDSITNSRNLEETESDNLFLPNAGNMMFVWIILLIIVILASVIKMYFGCISKAVVSLFTKIVGWLHWSGVLRIIIVTYPKLSQAALKQVNSLNFDSPVFIVSAIFGLLFIIFGVSFPIIAFYLIKKSSKNPETLKTKYSPLLGEFSLEGTMPKYFTVVALSRRFITLTSQIVLWDFPYIQVGILTALGVGNTIMLAIFRPYAVKSSNIIMIISEVFFTLLHALILIGVHDTQTSFLANGAKVNLGWVMMGCSSIVLGLSLEACVQAQVVVLKLVFKFLSNRKEKAKVTPLDNQRDIGRNTVQRLDKSNDMSKATEDRSMLDISSSFEQSYPYYPNPSTLVNVSSPTRVRRSNIRYKDPSIIDKVQRIKEMNSTAFR